MIIGLSILQRSVKGKRKQTLCSIRADSVTAQPPPLHPTILPYQKIHICSGCVGILQLQERQVSMPASKGR